ncbi:sugar phosphate isomerase/epimerase [Paracoccaceae bacterium]|jgi:sugar phosphate isomerase/epimerase|nr:sugar phosphate isomerase/epimerase [Marinovum sp.]MBT3651175.1 sugar phosphate isomerase/epimerase [Paracoccaceae bacterium]OAH09110.1 Xylose isomerase-like TIM barrel [Rhodobacteraceae bacterium SB2]MBT4230443.1 sugar phosphate isomerase/epimerase [Paracoccaceae bacterium]MBT4953298.1 sugar phosphate isomerase/epimerase [Paracoccaceae bacterium]|tara:strand:- start:1107 stop:1970 length:864 start_codon:yes stop_codon:yes gene_type:complete
MKLGVICDGISRDLTRAIDVMDEFDLTYAELQFVGDKEVGDHSAAEIAEMDQLLRGRGKPVSCLSRHIFAGTTSANRPGDALHQKHMDALKRVIEMAHILEAPLVRIMTQKKEQILWGRNGAEKWNVAHGAWDTMAPMIAPAVDLAKAEDVTLVVETGNGTMVNSNYTARKLIDELDAKETLKVLWDPGNNCWCHEQAFPDGYEAVKGGYLGHVHIKDVLVDTPRATLEVRRMGTGQLGPMFQPMADAMRADHYDGVISFESVFHPGNGDFEDGFRQCIGLFKEIFG